VMSGRESGIVQASPVEVGRESGSKFVQLKSNCLFSLSQSKTVCIQEIL